MRYEYCRVDGWNTWFKDRTSRPEDAELLKGTNDLRTRAVHREGARTQVHWILPDDLFTPELLAEIEAAECAGHTATFYLRPCEVHFDLGPKHLVTPTPNGVRVDRRVGEFPDQQVLPVCHKYLEWLAAIVAECEQRFTAF
jgi:hypothetical protein